MPLGLQWTLPLTRREAGIGPAASFMGPRFSHLPSGRGPWCDSLSGRALVLGMWWTLHVCSVGVERRPCHRKRPLLRFCRRDGAATPVCVCHFVPRQPLYHQWEPGVLLGVILEGSHLSWVDEVPKVHRGLTEDPGPSRNPGLLSPGAAIRFHTSPFDSQETGNTRAFWH